jgi:hypothetical protein
VSLIWVAVPVLAVEFAIIAGAAKPRTSMKKQHEGDIRLPYKKYKQLYPNTTMSYEDYKQMQTRDSYRRAINSKELKRMVR